MNDPHVEWLRYRLELGATLSVTDPPPLEHETDHFTLQLEARQLTVSMKEHHASTDAARARVEPFLRSWELDNDLTYGLGALHFVYEDHKLIDRSPPPPGSSQAITVGVGSVVCVGDAARVVVGRREYPPPPAHFTASPDVETLWNRFAGYKVGREPLPSMAFFCLSVVEALGGGRGKGARKVAAGMLGIDFHVLERFGDLISEKGDERTARKRPRSGWRSHRPAEIAWIEAVLKAAIRRVGEYAAGVRSFPLLTTGDFPSLPRRR